MIEATVISFAFLIAGSVLFLLYLRTDPSRDAPAWIADARVASKRGAPGTALALIKQAVSLPSSGRYNARQASTTADALDLLRELCQAQRASVPDAVSALRSQLGAEATQVDAGVVASAGEALQSMRLQEATA